MGMFSPIREGSWWIRSKIDPRWNAEGKGIVGGFTIPRECQQKIDQLKEKFGDPPKDLSWEYMKD